MNNLKEIENLKNKCLQTYWGYHSFRDLQKEIIDNIFLGRDTIALLPTGGGKSLCYQLPAILLEGTCLVISPLLALMKDQVYQLKNKGIEAEYISSEQDEVTIENILLNCKDGIVKILYISPERLQNNQFLENIQDIKISFIAVDEAHCISEWGQDFRPSYQYIKLFRQNFHYIPCIALTATATPKVIKEIKTKLGLANAEIFQKSFQRDNIQIFIDPVSDKYSRVLELLKYHHQSGIIYCRTRKEVENLYEFLKNKNFTNIDFFHAGISNKEKNIKQKKWLQEHNRVLISTNAFGMGIDKDNVRFVIHYSVPNSLENYYQEIGRSGRDGLASYAYLLWNEEEIIQFDEILKNQISNRIEFEKTIYYLYSLFQIAENELNEDFHELKIENLQSILKQPLSKIKNTLNFLHNQEILFYKNFKSPSYLELNILPEELDQISRKNSYFIELLIRNIPGIHLQKTAFIEEQIAQKIGIEPFMLKDKLKELKSMNYIKYQDGNAISIKFTIQRNDKLIIQKYWPIYRQIQENKIQKWEEMKFFIKEMNYCKMRLILNYFGEKNTQNCGKCINCKSKNKKSIESEIINLLSQHAMNIDQIMIHLQFHQKEKILEKLIHLLDTGIVKMKDFRTYTLN